MFVVGRWLICAAANVVTQVLPAREAIAEVGVRVSKERQELTGWSAAMKKDTVSKLKFKRLQRQLRLSLWQTIGVLEALWHCALSNTPDGDIGRLTNDDIASAIEWEDDADNLINALLECHWLDHDDVDRLIVHDWSQHVPGYLLAAYKKHGKSFADQRAWHRARHSATEDARDCARQDATDPAPILGKAIPSEAIQTGAPAAPPPKREPRAEDVLIPEALDTPEFLAARDRWLVRRRKQRWTVDILHIERTYERLLPLGVAKAIECFDLATDNGWQALPVERFENNGKPRNGTASSVAAKPVPKGTQPTFTDKF